MNFGYNCFSPRVLTNKNGEKIFARCGKCPACVASRRSEVTTLMHDYSKCYRFVEFFTLTYNEENVPYFDNGDLCFRSLCKPDIQKFLKRLRKNIDYEFKKNSCCDIRLSKNIAYFVCGEYGSHTYRPHYHGVIYHNSKYINDNFARLLAKSWKFGFIDSSVASGGKSFDYVAKYVAKSCSFLNHYDLVDEERKSVAPFLLHSSGLYNKEIALFKKEFEEIVRDCSLTRILSENDGSRIVRLKPQLENYLFPKCREFNCLSYQSLVERYTIYQRFKSAKEYANSVACDGELIDDFIYRQALSDYYKSRSFVIRALEFNYHPAQYLDKIFHYYENKNKFNLLDFYTCLSSLADNYKYRHNIVLYQNHHNYQQEKINKYKNQVN